MNVHKTFRKCSGRILNTLCPINLYLLIRGGQNDSKKRSRVSLFLYCSVFVLKQFHVNVPFLYILETSANQTFSDVCRGVYIWNIGEKLVNWKHSSAVGDYCPAKIYLFKVNNRNSRKMCEIYPKLSIKTP